MKLSFFGAFETAVKVEQSAIDRSLWTTQKHIAFGVKGEVRTDRPMQEPDPYGDFSFEMPNRFTGSE